MRLFVAVFPSPEIQAAAFALSESLRRPGDGVSWVKRENLHYTLRFIGEVGEDGARRVGEAVIEAASGRARFGAALGGLGAFPDPARARVLWVGLSEGGPELVALAGTLDGALERHGFDRPDHPFSAHLTLGRVREPRADWTARLGAAPAPVDSRFSVERLCVVESRLSPKGSSYAVRVEAPLSG